MRRISTFVFALALGGIVAGSTPMEQAATGVEERWLSFSPAELDAIERWLVWRAQDPPIPPRNPFEPGARSDQAVPLVAPFGPEKEERAAATSELRVTGFLRQAEGRVARRELAVIRYQGETWVVGAGDDVGSFRVESLVMGEEVVLADPASGRRIRLVLE